MVFKVHSMKKKRTIQKTKDQMLWEDFIVKNNIKKKRQEAVAQNYLT